MVLLDFAHKLLCTTELFGMTVARVLQSDEWARFPRGLEGVELFACFFLGAVATSEAELGLRSMAYDLKRIPGITEI